MRELEWAALSTVPPALRHLPRLLPVVKPGMADFDQSFIRLGRIYSIESVYYR